MTAAAASRFPRVSPVGATSILLVTLGLFLAVSVDMGFLILFALGAFGPTLARELGLLRDQDEFQRETSMRAAQRSFLATGIFLVAVIVAKQWGTANLEQDGIAASAVLCCLVVTHFMSKLTGFWGPQRAAARILVTFGMLWLGFVILSHGRGEQWAAFGAELLLVLPFFALAYACGRWPRVSGMLVLAAAAGAFVLFKIARAFSGDPSSLVVGLTFVLPLLVSGLALMGVGGSAREATPAA